MKKSISKDVQTEVCFPAPGGCGSPCEQLTLGAAGLYRSPATPALLQRLGWAVRLTYMGHTACRFDRLNWRASELESRQTPATPHMLGSRWGLVKTQLDTTRSPELSLQSSRDGCSSLSPESLPDELSKAPCESSRVARHKVEQVE